MLHRDDNKNYGAYEFDSSKVNTFSYLNDFREFFEYEEFSDINSQKIGNYQ